MSTAIRFEAVSKFYRLNAGQSSLREALSVLPRRFTQHNRPQTAGHWALKSVSFELEQGRVLGVIGHNGAGKTTMLKILSRVTRPTSGRLRVDGRISALIELGAGFHPDLSGRENVFLNGAILGLSQSEIRHKFDSIVAFAEVEKFIDVPIKRYSSGMYARLGFAVAVHADPEVLLIDEVLAVGDVNFQQKCFDFIHSFVTSGRTTVFVSHNLYALEQLSDEIVWLDQGGVRDQGPGKEILARYMKAQDEELMRLGSIRHEMESSLVIGEVNLVDGQGQPRIEFTSGEDISVCVHYTALEPVSRPHFVIAVWDAATRQPVFIASMLADGDAPECIVGRGQLQCYFVSPSLMPRTYQVWGEVWGGDRKRVLVQWQPLAAFTISDDSDALAGAGGLRHRRADAPMKVPYRWLTTTDS
jgi:ABC-type polysaccharide/polyol phosphate transport system ATPase subunit